MDSVGPTFTTAAPDQSSFYNNIVSLGSLRLLRKVKTGDKDDDVRFTLETAELDSCPAFAAVSYCWGNPYDSFVNTGDTEQLSFSEQVDLDGLPFAMTPNALAALKHAASVSDLEYLWMDALCINQTSLTERADQVAQMDKVFARANYVIAWLGPSHPKFDGLAFMINDFLPFTAFLRQICGDEMLMSHPPEAIALEDGFGVEKYKQLQKDAEDFCKDCRWFFRTWIPQECILAREIHLYCGSVCFDAQGFAKLHDIFHSTNWSTYCSPYLAQFGEWFKFARLFHDSNAWLQGPQPNYMDTFRTQECEPGLWTLTQIVNKLRTTTCSDPRDKLYAALPMASRYFTNDIQQFLKVDYSRTVEDVYTDFSRMIIENTGSLSTLSSVGDRADRKTTRLPSWVSDYSTTSPIFPRDLQSLVPREQRINAAGLAKRIEFTSDTLLAFGACFATVAACVKGDDRSEPLSGVAVVELLRSGKYAGDSQENRAEACCRMLMSDASRTLQPHGVHKDVRVVYADRAEPSQLFWAWLNVQLVSQATALVYHGVSMVAVEHFLGSLLANFDEEQKAGFVPHVGEIMAPILFDENESLVREEERKDVELLCQKYQGFTFRPVDSGQVPFVEGTPSDVQKAIEVMYSQYAKSIRPPPLSEYSNGLHSALARRHDVFASKMKLTMMGKECLFRTKEGFLGVGPYSLKPGDQIWFVQSCSEPLAFRPSGEPDTFTLLGGCYLHKFMEDEIFDPKWNLQEKWKQFKLI